MSRSLNTLRLLVVVAAIFASGGCSANPFASSDEGGIGIAGGPNVTSCPDTANAGTPGCRH